MHCSEIRLQYLYVQMSCCRADWTAYICRGDKLNSMYRCWAVQGRGLVKGYQGGYPPISRCTGMPAGTWGQGTSDQSKQSSSSTPCRLIWTEQFVGWITCKVDLTYTVAWFRKELLREDILCCQTPVGQSANQKSPANLNIYQACREVQVNSLLSVTDTFSVYL